MHHPPRAVAEHRGAPHRDAGVGNAAGQRIGCEHPHRAPEHLARPIREQPPARRALAERLEGGEALHRVEELRGEAPVRHGPAHAAPGVPAMEQRRGEQGEHREAEQQRGDREVQEREQHQDDDRGGRGGDELRQVFAEVRLELLDPVHHREQHVAGALQPEVGGAERDHLRVEPLAQHELHPRRGAVGDHGAGVLDESAQHHHHRHEHEGQDQIGEGIPREHPREQPAQQREPPDPDQGRKHPHRRGGGDPQAHPARERPELGVEEHGTVLGSQDRAVRRAAARHTASVGTPAGARPPAVTRTRWNCAEGASAGADAAAGPRFAGGSCRLRLLVIG